MATIDDYLGLFIQIIDKEILIFGAGAVACRRAQSFLEKGALVHVLGRDIHPDFQSLQKNWGEKLKIQQQEISLKDLEEAVIKPFLVVIALSDATLAERLSLKAAEKNILVNDAVQALRGNVVVPARLETKKWRLTLVSRKGHHKELKKFAQDLRRQLDEDHSSGQPG